METGTLAAEILARLKALPNRQTATVRALRREYSKRLAPERPEFVIALALELRAQPDFLPRFIGYELVHDHRAALKSLRVKDLLALGKGLNSWYAVDTFAPLLSGPAWREGQVPDSLIQRWAHSKDLWWRRAALVSTIALNNTARGGKGDSARTLTICKLLVADREDMVVKAMSWALRELAKRDPKAVQAFIQKYEAKLVPRVKREVGNKLRTGLKNPRG
jgi:3-methyladenine DNA glycosylase AlkD